LDFPDYYGRNLDALNDRMRDVVTQATARRRLAGDAVA